MRQVEIVVGHITIKADVLDTPTADRIWRALPIFATVKTWPHIVYFETDVESGLEPGAGMHITPGDIAFIPDQDTVAIAYALQPGSPQEPVLLPRPANVWARTDDDVGVLAQAHGGLQALVRQFQRTTGSAD